MICVCRQQKGGQNADFLALVSGQGFSCWLRKEGGRRTENELRGLLLLAFRPAVLALWLCQLHSPESGKGRKWECSASYSKSREQEEEETGP